MTQESAIEKFVEFPHELVKEMRATGDLHEGFRFIDFIAEVDRTLDSTLDIILPAMEDIFTQTPQPEYKGMTFYEAVKSSTTLSQSMLDRHLKVGRMLERVPEAIRPRVEVMDFKSKEALVTVVNNDYPITKKQWDDIASSQGHQDVREVVHEITGKSPRKQWCKFVADEDGTIWVKTVYGTFKYREPIEYENEEIAKVMDWVHKKVVGKLEATKR